MTATQIEYRDENNVTVVNMSVLLDQSRDYAVLTAQKYLDQFPKLTAHVFVGDSQIVVHRATEWQKRNG